GHGDVRAGLSRRWRVAVVVAELEGRKAGGEADLRLRMRDVERRQVGAPVGATRRPVRYLQRLLEGRQGHLLVARDHVAQRQRALLADRVRGPPEDPVVNLGPRGALTGPP